MRHQFQWPERQRSGVVYWGIAVSAANDRWSSPPPGYDPVRSLGRMAGDARLAVVFKQIRAIIGVSEIEMARRLGTDVSVILDFEAGAVDALPPWQITSRLVERYAAMADVDPSPILSRLIALQTPVLGQPLGQQARQTNGGSHQPGAMHQAHAPQRQAYVPAPPHAGAAAMPVTPATNASLAALNGGRALNPATGAPSTVADYGFATRNKLRTGEATRTQPASVAPAVADAPPDPAAVARRRRRLRRSLTVAAPVAAIVGVFALLQMTPKPLYAAARMLPSPIDQPVRSLVDIFVVQNAPLKDGLRWIDAGDPRIRKADRLRGR